MLQIFLLTCDQGNLKITGYLLQLAVQTCLSCLKQSAVIGFPTKRARPCGGFRRRRTGARPVVFWLVEDRTKCQAQLQ